MYRCCVCGSVITSQQSIERGVGPECAKAVNKARMKLLFSKEGNSLYYNWVIKVQVYRNKFIDVFKDTKFRKEWKRSFYQSICSSEKVSKKQLKVMVDWLFYKNINMEELGDEVDFRKREFLLENTKGLTKKAIEIARREIRSND